MADLFFPLLMLLVALAVLIREPLFPPLVYLLLGIFLVGRWWTTRAMQGFRFERKFTPRAFPGEVVEVALEVENKSWLPILWVDLRENLPVNLAGANLFHQVTSLPPRAEHKFKYRLSPNARGVYRIGPLNIRSSDLMGLTQMTLSGGTQDLIVYPTVLPLQKVAMPSFSPIGTLKSQRILLDDPNRPMGKREYQVGDSPRRIDWKATAASGRMQVKQMESSIALDSAIFLDFYRENYHYRRRIEATELAVVTAASVANWVAGQRQQVGFYTNAVDAFTSPKAQLLPVLSGKGQAHLMRILETLARADLSDENNFETFFRQQRVRLAWGASVMVITGHGNDALFEALYAARQAGLSITLALCGPVGGIQEIQAKGRAYHIPVFHFHDQRDLNIWK